MRPVPRPSDRPPPPRFRLAVAVACAHLCGTSGCFPELVGLDDSHGRRFIDYGNVQVTTHVYATVESEESEGDDPPLYLDLYQPLDPEGEIIEAPLVMWIHGGAWQEGDRSEVVIVVAARLLAYHGYSVVAIDYRLIDNLDFPTASGSGWTTINT